MRKFLFFVLSVLLFSCSDVLLSSEYIGPTPQSSSSVAVSSSSSSLSSSSVIAGDDPQSSSSSVYWNTGISYGTLTDSRDGNSYRTVEMPDGNVWMAENLNYNASGSWCYNDNTSNCDTYGRLYDWSTAMAISTSYNSSNYSGSDVNHQGVCPVGWHLPSDAEWDALATAVGGASTAGIKLKAVSGWNYYSDEVSGTDDYGFSALPGGYRNSGVGSFCFVGSCGFWWSATEGDASLAYGRLLYYYRAGLDWVSHYKEDGFSVRCLQDYSSSSSSSLSSSSVISGDDPQSSSSSEQSSSSVISSSSSSSSASTIPDGFSCGWSNDYPSVIAGDKIKPGYTLANESDWTAKGCGEVTYKTNSSNAAACNQYTAEVPTEGITAESGTYFLCAYFTCNGTSYNQKCPAAEVVVPPAYSPAPTITCSYEVQPYGSDEYASANSATSGDNVKIKYEVTDANGGCSAPTFTITNAALNDIGSVAGGEGEALFSPSTSASSITISASSVKANFTCSADRYSTTTPSIACTGLGALTLSAVPKPAKSGGAITLNVDYSTNIYFISTAPAVASNTVGFTISDTEQGNCGAVMDSLVGSTATAGVNAVKAYAIVKCREATYLLDSAMANVVGNPSWQSGAKCEWNTNNNTFGGGVVASVKAMPTVSSIDNNYGRCGTPYLTRDGELWSGVVDDWNGSDPQTLGDLGISSECSDGSKLTLTCPDITVRDPSPSGTFIDERDGQEYSYVTIGSQVWMSENLNYTPGTGNSWCYSNSASYCDTYGRLYDWSTAMAISTSYNSSNYSGSNVNRQGVCPIGWHLPSDAEWTALANAVGGASTAGTKLKATSGWYNSGNGTDDYGFSALPGGYRYYDGSFDDVGNFGNWWSSTEYNASYAYFRNLSYRLANLYRVYDIKEYGFSVRCLRD